MTKLCIPHASDLVRGGPNCTVCDQDAEIARLLAALRPFAAINLTSAKLPDPFALDVLRARSVIADHERDAALAGAAVQPTAEQEPVPVAFMQWDEVASQFRFYRTKRPGATALYPHPTGYRPAVQPDAARMARIETLMHGDPSPGTPEGDELVRLATEQERYETETPAMRLDRLAEEAAADYEFCGDEGDYAPNEHERMLLTDFALGLVADDKLIDAAAAAWATRLADKPSAGSGS